MRSESWLGFPALPDWEAYYIYYGSMTGGACFCSKIMTLIEHSLSLVFWQDTLIDRRYPEGSWIFSADILGVRSRLQIQIRNCPLRSSLKF